VQDQLFSQESDSGEGSAEIDQGNAEAQGKQRPQAERSQSIDQGYAIGSDPSEEIAVAI
jgi:hypothetical protein